MFPRTMRRVSLVVLLGALLFLTLASSAFASKWAFVQPSSFAQGVRADIYTPSSSLSGIPAGTTVKAAVWVEDYYGWGYPNAGWLIVPGTYNDLRSYFIYTDMYGGEHLGDPILSTQPYGVSRAYEIYFDPGPYPYNRRWTTKIVGDWRCSSYMGSDYQHVMAGGKTSADNANLWSHLTTVQYNPTGGGYTNFPSSSSVSNDVPLIISLINNAKYNFNTYNDNYW
jgi:hypothetical protein